jgi:N-hydroxyarylamine O-acetyltransferase
VFQGTYMNLDAYFQRIGYEGDRSPTLENITQLVIRHTHSIPFENLNPLLGWPVTLDLPSLEQKLVQAGRGGYCFEQNAMFLHVLRSLGVPVKSLAARVLWNWEGEEVSPRSHMLLLAEIEGETYLVDVGFGVHGAIAEHYGVSEDEFPPTSTTLDYVVAAAGG